MKTKEDILKMSKSGLRDYFSSIKSLYDLNNCSNCSDCSSYSD